MFGVEKRYKNTLLQQEDERDASLASFDITQQKYPRIFLLL